MKRMLITALLVTSGTCQAYDGLSSELSHAAGGALLAGSITYVYRDLPNRAWIGFMASTAAGVLVESASIANGGKRSSQYLDMASHAVGSAIGAWWSDRYLLVPVISRSSVGVVYSTRF
ncbi:MAG: hypothetical protein RL697_170 [Pseudomonadota bacterium]|jgi:hypothetical protein